MTGNLSAPAALRGLFIASLCMLLFACGGSGDNTLVAPPAGAGCEPADEATAGECGTLFLALTDLDGDFLEYAVDVVGVSLTSAAGRSIELLPASLRLDFAQYVDVAELVAVSRVPPGRYTEVALTLDYGDASVQVEREGAAARAIVVDETGAPLETARFAVELDGELPLVIARGAHAMLTLDFDLSASHRVDLAPTPIEARAAPVLIAELMLPEGKQARLRGLIRDVDPEAGEFALRLRPAHRPSGYHGTVTVTVDEGTHFLIDGQAWADPVEALRAMAALPDGAWALVFGQRDGGRFLAERVKAGSSVPGAGFDVARGNVLARDGNTLTLLGAFLETTSGVAGFRERLRVELSPETTVVKRSAPGELLAPAAISVGQRLHVWGEIDAEAEGPTTLLARRAVLLPTRVAGHVSAVSTDELSLRLVAIDGRSPTMFDFSGTGMSAELDSDPAAYQVLARPLPPSPLLELGSPARAIGHVREFGNAPPDFEAFGLQLLPDARARLLARWERPGSTAALLEIGPAGLVLDPADPVLAFGFLAIAGVRAALADLPQPPRVTGTAQPGVYAIRAAGGTRMYRDFSRFAEALALALSGGATLLHFEAGGQWRSADGTLAAHRVVVRLHLAD